MKKLCWLLAGIVASAALVFGAGVAAADESGPGPRGPEAPLAAEFHNHPWLVESIVLAAAQTLNVPPEQIKEALRYGASLAAIGFRHDVRPPALAAGIVRHERVILQQMVENGRITPQEARRALAFVTDNIGRIIYHNFGPGPI